MFLYYFSRCTGHENCQTVATILKVFPSEDRYKCNLINLFVLGKTTKDKDFEHQALELKRLILRYNPREVVIDINGMGVGFADFMIKETYDPITQKTLPAYGFFNREEYLPRQGTNAIKILYGFKATGNLNSQMHSICYSKIYGGEVKFLISEQNARVRLLATRAGQRMTPEQRNLRLLPHQLTSILINEMLNLKLKPTGVAGMISLDLINKRMTKDKFSAFEMGLFRINEIQEENKRHFRNKGLTRKLVFMN